MDDNSIMFIQVVCPLSESEGKVREAKKLLLEKQSAGYVVAHESSNVYALNNISFFSYFIRIEKAQS